MAQDRDLGLFWGQNTFHFVETVNNNPINFFSIPYQITKDIANFTFTDTKEGSQIVEIIQSALKEHDIQATSINLALPTKDTIFRSFVIPWMQSSEINGVVEFEVSKYIPFKLDELSYKFQNLSFTENKKRQILISFVAIRKDILEIYCGLLEHIGLKINFIEPASISMARVLASKKIFPKNQTIAVIDTDQFSGRILIISNNFPEFVREFQLSLPSETQMNSPDALQARLFNEIRISLDYFGRQHEQKVVDEIILIAADSNESLPINLREYIDKPVKILNVNEVFQSDKTLPSGLLNAYGTCLHNTVLTNINFDLPRKSQFIEEAAEGESKPNYVTVAITVAVCVSLIFLSNFLSGRMLSDLSTKSLALKEQLGPYQSSPIKDIEKLVKDSTAKFNEYKSINTKSIASLYLTLTPYLMPEGIWLKDFSLAYRQVKGKRSLTETKLYLQISGFAYLDDVNQQVDLVNILLKNLKASKQFAENFKEIKLAAVNRTVINEFSVMSFDIKCE